MFGVLVGRLQCAPVDLWRCRTTCQPSRFLRCDWHHGLHRLLAPPGRKCGWASPISLPPEILCAREAPVVSMQPQYSSTCDHREPLHPPRPGQVARAHACADPWRSRSHPVNSMRVPGREASPPLGRQKLHPTDGAAGGAPPPTRCGVPHPPWLMHESLSHAQAPAHDSTIPQVPSRSVQLPHGRAHGASAERHAVPQPH